MFTRKTIYGFIFVVYSLYCHQIYTDSNEDKRVYWIDPRIYALLTSGVIYGAIGARTLSARSVFRFPIGGGLIGLGLYVIFHSKESLKKFDNRGRKTIPDKIRIIRGGFKKLVDKGKKVEQALFEDDKSGENKNDWII